MSKQVYAVSNLGSVKLIAFIITIIITMALSVLTARASVLMEPFGCFQRKDPPPGAILPPHYSLVIGDFRIY
jgi:hypothetical protein